MNIMKNLIFQYHLEVCASPELLDTYEQSGKISSERFKKYAEHIGADYEFATEPTYVTVGEYPRGEERYFEWFRLIYDDKYDEYDNILFVDHDIIPNTDKNIFDHIEGDINGVYESEWEGWSPWDNYNSADSAMKENILHIYSKMERMNYPIVNIFSPTPSQMMVVNTGVLILTREGRKILREELGDWKPYVDDSWTDKDNPLPTWISNDQYWFSWECAKKDIEVNCMDRRWNGKSIRDDVFHDNYFIHFQGIEERMRLVEMFK